MSKNKQKAIFVSQFELEELNDDLNNGWYVKSMCPVEGTGNVLVILEEDKEKDKKPLGFGEK